MSRPSMSAVNVLAVMDDFGAFFKIRQISPAAAASSKRLNADWTEARAAVAELIRASDDYADVIENAYDVTQTAPALARLRAALAAVGAK